MNESIILAPASLTAQNRTEFRDNAMDALERLGDAEPGGSLVIDLEATQRLDSAGLGTLVLIQFRAAERKHVVNLRAASEDIRFLLLMTRLEDRFTFEPRA